MADPRRNAAIWYAADGYDPASKGINGRRVAGASFLKGFVQHADVDEFVSLSERMNGAKAFAARLAELGATKPVRGVTTFTSRKMAPLETLYYPAPNFANELWRRQSLGHAAFSICGITHTTATTAVMQGLMDLRSAPQQEWDAVICTSHAVKASQEAQLDMIDTYLAERFGKVPPRPQMPVIPLGLTCDDYAHNSTARARLRRRMGWKKDDIVISTLSRLTPYGKFDPFPLFMALEAASKRLAKSQKLHFVACGIYIDGHSKKVFEEGAAALMPSVSYTHLDGASQKARDEALSGADIFTFPIDNIQETFGLAPLEAMAAGLPQITTDWDGMRDTVSDDVGIRIPTRSLTAAHGRMDAWSYQSNRMTYAQYGNTTSALTEVDLDAFTNAIVALAKDPNKRKTMATEAVKRVKQLYDWGAIIPQYQELWGELSSIRRHAMKNQKNMHLYPNPVAPPPQHLFGSYPTVQLPKGVSRCVAQRPKHTIAEMFELRGYTKMGNPFERPQTVQSVFDAIAQTGKSGADAKQVAVQLKLNPLTVDRCFVWLLKYGYLTRLRK